MDLVQQPLIFNSLCKVLFFEVINGLCFFLVAEGALIEGRLQLRLESGNGLEVLVTHLALSLLEIGQL